MIKKRVLSVSAAVMLGMTALTSPPVVAQPVEDTVTKAQATYAETTYPDVEWEQAENGNLYSIPENGDRSLNCSVDWNVATILDHRLDDHSNNGFTMKVFDESHAGQSRGYASLQHWGTSETSTVAFWRPVVAFDADVNDAAVVLTVPAADYSVSDASSWFVNNYLPAVVPGNPYDTPATVLDTDIQTAGDTTTITFRLGDVKAGTGFGASLNGDIGQTGVTGSMRITGNFVRGSENDVEDCQLPAGSSNGSSDARCVQAAATVGIPLLALIPIGLATQVNIPGLSPLVADAQAQLQSINTDLQQQSGIYDDETARLIAQINAELEKNGGAIGQAVGAAAVIAIGGLVGKYLYDNCVPRA